MITKTSQLKLWYHNYFFTNDIKNWLRCKSTWAFEHLNRTRGQGNCVRFDQPRNRTQDINVVYIMKNHMSLTVRWKHVSLKHRNTENVQANIFDDELHSTVPLRVQRVLKHIKPSLLNQITHPTLTPVQIESSFASDEPIRVKHAEQLIFCFQLTLLYRLKF